MNSRYSLRRLLEDLLLKLITICELLTAYPFSTMVLSDAESKSADIPGGKNLYYLKTDCSYGYEPRHLLPIENHLGGCV